MSERKAADYNILNYVGDNNYTLSQLPFNEIDGLVLTQIANIEFGECAPLIYSKKSITIEKIFYRINEDDFVWEKLTEQQKKLLEVMAESGRFKDMELSNYVVNPAVNNIEGFKSVSDEAQETEQFAAIVITMKEGRNTLNFLAFRATDGSVEGWNEDFSMISENVTQAQEDAAAYMNLTSPLLKGALTGGGHSKGGNNFAYGFLYCDEAVRERFISGYLYDSPGLSDFNAGNENYGRLQEITQGRFICPDVSIIGMLLNENRNALFVKSAESGFNAHDPFTWEIASPDNRIDLSGISLYDFGHTQMLRIWSFVYKEQTEFSKELNLYLDKAIRKMSAENKKAIFDFVNYILFNSGVDEFGELASYFLGNKNDSIKVRIIRAAERVLFLLRNYESRTKEEQRYLIQAVGILLYTAMETAVKAKAADVIQWLKDKISVVKNTLDSCTEGFCEMASCAKEVIVDFFTGVKEFVEKILDKAARWYGKSSFL